MSSYLHDVTKHGEKLQTVVNKLLADEHFKNDPDKKVEILFFLTIYHFLNKRTDAGVESLINAYKISAKVTEQIKVGLVPIKADIQLLIKTYFPISRIFYRTNSVLIGMMEDF